MSFRFQQFYVEDDRCAMKVGTDGVLLGSWVSVCDPRSILDVGTGSGLIGLMLAQRAESTTTIIGIEIEEGAANQAAENFSNSPWSERMTALCADFKTFSSDGNRFDLIVSNPPYFSNSFAPASKKVQLARHDDSLTLDELLEKASELLSPNGRLALILPSETEEGLLEIGRRNHLFPIRITRVKGSLTGKIKRLLVEFSRQELPSIEVEELALEEDRHCYTKEYRELTKAFYL